MKARNGLWTPWAEVLCHDCHGPEFQDGTKKLLEGFTGPEMVNAPLSEGFERTPCNKCGAMCWTRNDVALLNTFRLALTELLPIELEVRLSQTGGMCVALEIKLLESPTAAEDARYASYVLVTEDEETSGRFVLGRYLSWEQYPQPEDIVITDSALETIKMAMTFFKLES